MVPNVVGYLNSLKSHSHAAFCSHLRRSCNAEFASSGNVPGNESQTMTSIRSDVIETFQCGLPQDCLEESSRKSEIHVASLSDLPDDFLA
ncbi:hypothetical protein TNCV_438361 [Trichonephila clavipes]|nr:hypothetical protein TNCV_438361 [Trichonephila clavipes]